MDHLKPFKRLWNLNLSHFVNAEEKMSHQQRAHFPNIQEPVYTGHIMLYFFAAFFFLCKTSHIVAAAAEHLQLISPFTLV